MMAEVIIALDLPSGAEALRLLDRVPEARWVKVGSILMTREGPDLVRTLVRRGLSVFLDLKWHDIPNTVSEAVGAARELGVALATVHTLGGARMMAAAVASAGADLKLIGVTVLTSHDATSYARAIGRPEMDLLAEVERQSVEALEAGLAGLVCSPREVAAVRHRLGPQALIVVPGIRRGSDPEGDQIRVATAADAVAAGATHLVIGRPILQAGDAGAAFRGFVEEAQCVGS
ncbi:MAG TPA: orotidine-5'-phosphate decarboxylase [Gemmatimonadales bacterium]|jgi:orotidine-5'-phosphate decarboxylase|nr:orotidine-5'-phosphate decarboxylase [Gemmatimonadales bacterium]